MSTSVVQHIPTWIFIRFKAGQKFLRNARPVFKEKNFAKSYLNADTNADISEGYSA
jgi:hypothetical protein